MMRPTLFLLDCQQSAGTGPAEHDPGHASRGIDPRVVSHIRRLLITARHSGWRVIHSQFQGEPVPGELAPQGAESGAALACQAVPITGLEPLARETVFIRTALSAYADPDFGRVIESCSQTPVYVVGCSAPFSVLATAFDAHACDHVLTIIPEAMGAPALTAESGGKTGNMAFELLSRLVRIAPYSSVESEWMAGAFDHEFLLRGTG